MADIDHEIKIQATPEKTFKALSTLNDLKAWHTANIEEQSGSKNLSFNATGKPQFVWHIVASIPNKQVTWECVKGPGDSTGTKAIYNLSKTDDGRTLVELSHIFWPDETGNFRKCNTLWGVLLNHLKKYVETNKTDPAIL